MLSSSTPFPPSGFPTETFICPLKSSVGEFSFGVSQIPTAKAKTFRPLTSVVSAQQQHMHLPDAIEAESKQEMEIHGQLRGQGRDAVTGKGLKGSARD